MIEAAREREEKTEKRDRERKGKTKLKVVAFSNAEKDVLSGKMRCIQNGQVVSLHPENIQFRVTCVHKLPARSFGS